MLSRMHRVRPSALRSLVAVVAVGAVIAVVAGPARATAGAAGAVDCARCHDECRAGAYPDNASPGPPSTTSLRHASAAAEQAFVAARQADPAFGGASARAAVEGYRRALALDPGNIAYRNHLAAALLTVGESDEAVRILAEIVQVVPREGKYLVNLGYAWHRSGDEQRALVWYLRALAIDDGDVRAHLFAGYAMELLGMPGEATAEFRRVLASQPDHDGARRALQRLGVLPPSAASKSTQPPPALLGPGKGEPIEPR